MATINNDAECNNVKTKPDDADVFMWRENKMEKIHKYKE